MALRQKIALPGFEWQVCEELRALRALRQPKDVEFRRSSSPADVVSDFLQYNSVRLMAAVGSGKSVRIPAALAARTKALVFHVVPSRQLASHLFGYLVKLSQCSGTDIRVPLEKYSGDVDHIPRNGVYFISAVDMVDVLMRHGGLSDFKGCSVFLDEAHESDAYTHVVRTVVLQMGAERLVQASATFNPDVRAVRETPGTVLVKPVDLGSPDQWEVDRAGSPFQIGTMHDGVLVFVDSRSAATKLAVAYERAGLDVFRLTSSSTDEEVTKAMHSAVDQRGGLFAILADYTYRSGFTFPVSRVVDTGEVSYYDSKPGEFRRLSRRMFQFEREQASGRVGRISGGAEYYYQKGPCEAIMCDLEGVEREAAAYIYRCLGFRPDGVLSGAFMVDHDLPAGVSIRAALNGPYPLTYYVKNSAEAIGLPKNEYRERLKIAPQPPSYKDSVGGADVREEVRPYVEKRDSGYVSHGDENWDSMVDEFASQESQLLLQDGTYYVSQVRDSKGRGVVASMTFPSGLHSVREFALKRNFQFAVTSLSREDRMWAFSALLDRYNTITAQIKGAKAAVKDSTGGARSLSFVDKVRDTMEELSADHADALACLRAAEVFAMSPSWVTAYEGVLKAEAAAKNAYYKQLVEEVVIRNHDDLDDDIAGSLDSRVERVRIRDRDRGRESERYEGRKHELRMPSWMGGSKVIYDSARDDDVRARAVGVMNRDYGHDDRKHDYKLVRRYVRITHY